jgi:hypothetical protein
MTPQTLHQLQLLPGGVAVLFAWGYTPGLLKKGTVEIRVDSNAFTALFTLKREMLHMSSKGAFSCGFAEKTLEDW